MKVSSQYIHVYVFAAIFMMTAILVGLKPHYAREFVRLFVQDTMIVVDATHEFIEDVQSINFERSSKEAWDQFTKTVLFPRTLLEAVREELEDARRDIERRRDR